MELKSLYTFLDTITLPVQFLGFENEFISFPAPFTVLGKLNSVISKSRKTGRTVNFKYFLKRPFSGSGKREARLHEIQEVLDDPKLTIKEIHSVRWLSYFTALTAVWRTLDSLFTYLAEASSEDNKAKGLKKKIATDTFISTTYMMMDAMAPVTVLSQFFQTENIDIALIKISLETDGDEAYMCLTDEEGNKRKHTESGAGREPSKRARKDQGKSCSQCSIRKDLCDHEVIDLHSDEVTQAMNNLNNFLDKDNLHCLFKVLENFRDEDDLEIGLGIHLITKLTGNAFTRRWKAQRDCICGCTEKLGASDEMYIGSQNTWYGELDILAGNPGSGRSVAVTICESVRDDRDENEDEEENLSDSPGNRTNVEVKSVTDGSRFNEAVAQSIVFAFTEFNRHTDKGCVIPSMLIDKTMYYIVMYNPVTDILMSFSNTYNFGPKPGDKGEFIRAILILWVTLNHRIFFAKFPKLRDEQQSEFGSKINDLQKYRELKNFSKVIKKKSTDDFKYPIGVSYLDVSNLRETFTVFKEIETSVMNKTEKDSDNK